ncbi:hypothetical protein [Azospirillum halopraeferens]|uniref:hypothetical protein n=1 Tax=Azospirillum halopraeferens TaxID=34010 RepID=UPI0004140902|nr:hypothetical protein [Azospirillum halopraeferens]
MPLPPLPPADGTPAVPLATAVGGPAAAGPPRRFDRERVTLWRVALVAGMAFLYAELIAVIIGMDDILFRQLVALSVGGAGFASIGWLAWRGELFRHPFALWPLVLVAVMLMVSLFSNTIFFPKPLKDWLPAHYVYLPVMQLYILMALRFTDREVIWGLAFAGLVAAVLMVVYRFGLWDVLSHYARRSIFGLDVSRIVIMKHEFFFASLAMFAVLLAPSVPFAGKVAAAVALAVCMALQIEVVQSRQGMLATGVGMLVMLAVDRRSFHTKPFLVRATMLVIGAMVVPLLMWDYVEMLFRDDLLDSRELNVAVRFHTFDHYSHYFHVTHGLGFGMMSATGTRNNVLAESLSMHVNITDLGLYGSFMQFGIVGGSLAVLLTGFVIYYSLRTARRLPQDEAWMPALLGAYFLGWMCVPVQLNAFTMSTSIHFGAFVFYLAWYYRCRGRYEAMAGASRPGAPGAAGALPAAA